MSREWIQPDDKLWEVIRTDWENNNVTYAMLEKKYNVRRTTIRSRKYRENWIKAEDAHKHSVEVRADERERRRKKTSRKTFVDAEGKEVVIKIPNPTEDDASDRKVSRMQVAAEDLDDGLNDLQRLFCLHYMRYFNATKAYQKAYGVTNRTTAHNQSYKLMKLPKIQRQLDRLKREQVVALKLDAQDVLQQYIDIAFADITDYIEFGTEDVPILIKGKDTGRTEPRNYARFKQDTAIDGMVVSEIKLGKDGIGVKLHDKMKALEMLTKYFDLLDVNTQRKLQEEKLKLEIRALELENGDAEGGGGKTIILSGEDQMRAYIAQQKSK